MTGTTSNYGNVKAAIAAIAVLCAAGALAALATATPSADSTTARAPAAISLEPGPLGR